MDRHDADSKSGFMTKTDSDAMSKGDGAVFAVDGSNPLFGDPLNGKKMELIFLEKKEIHTETDTEVVEIRARKF
jgi:hypothetical protein